MADFRLLYGAVALFAGAGLLGWAAPLSAALADPLRALAALAGTVLFVAGGATMVKWASL